MGRVYRNTEVNEGYTMEELKCSGTGGPICVTPEGLYG